VTRVILDTNLYVGWLNRGLHADLMLGPGLVRYLSAVVHMELRVGATTRSARRALEQLARPYAAAGRLVAPRAGLFRDAGQVLQELPRKGRDVRRAALVNDLLIALTARDLGATVYTADAGDFEAMRAVRDFSLEVVGR